MIEEENKMTVVFDEQFVSDAVKDQVGRKIAEEVRSKVSTSNVISLVDKAMDNGAIATYGTDSWILKKIRSEMEQVISSSIWNAVNESGIQEKIRQAVVDYSSSDEFKTAMAEKVRSSFVDEPLRNIIKET